MTLLDSIICFAKTKKKLRERKRQVPQYSEEGIFVFVETFRIIE